MRSNCSDPSATLNTEEQPMAFAGQHVPGSPQQLAPIGIPAKFHFCFLVARSRTSWHYSGDISVLYTTRV